MRLTKRKITVPIPDVQPINAPSPFVLMEFIEAVPLYEIWLEKTTSKAVME